MPELIDAKTTMKLLGIGSGTLHYLVDRGDLEAFTYAPEGKQHRIFFLKTKVEALAADESWRRKRKPGSREE